MVAESAVETPADLAVGPRRIRSGRHPLAWLIVRFLRSNFLALLAAVSELTKLIGPVILPVLRAGLVFPIYRALILRLAKRALLQVDAGRFLTPRCWRS